MKRVLTEIDAVAKKVEEAVTTSEMRVAPMRNSLFKRFPVLATFLVTFGVAATFFGMERMIADIAWLNDRPFLIFTFGLLALVLSGKLYQKLG